MTTPPNPTPITEVPANESELRRLLLAMRRNLIAATKIAAKIEAMVVDGNNENRAA